MTAPTRVRIAAEHRGAYHAMDPETHALAWVELTGKAYNRASDKRALPTVGDYVLVDDWARALAGNGAAVIREIEPRTAFLVRRAAGEATAPQPIAANVDRGFVLTSANTDVSPARLDRYLGLLRDGNIAPVLVLSKIDLVDDVAPIVDRLRALAADVPVVAISHRDVSPIRAHVPTGGTAILLGSSGVGKSTLLNALAQTAQPTSHIRADERGRHTTTRRELFVAPDGTAWIDTPGMRELAQYLDEATDAELAFDDIAALAAACRFRDCTHHAEPGCAVVGAVAPARLASFHKLADERRATAAKRAEAARIAETRQARYRKHRRS